MLEIVNCSAILVGNILNVLMGWLWRSFSVLAFSFDSANALSFILYSTKHFCSTTKIAGDSCL